ncbi:MAG: enoyl-CoA hydratase/isomerase family protein [Pararhodobacter sp.]
MTTKNDESLVLTSRAGNVATLTLNRPGQGNAMTQPLWEALHAALTSAAADPETHAIVVTGAGKSFCAGADIDRLRSFADGGAADTPMERPNPAVPDGLALGPGFDDRWSWLARIPKPLIAAINGPVVGSGFCFAMFCDIRIAAREARLSTGFARLGLVGEMALPWILSRTVGPHVAADLLFSARFVSGEEAEKIGLVNRSVPQADLAETAQTYAATLAGEVSPVSVKVMKQQLWRGLVQDLDAAVDDYYPAMAESFRSEDFRTRARSLLERLKR